MRTEAIDETLLDELQSKVRLTLYERVFFVNEKLILKVFEILSSDRYYGQFKTTPQYLKVLSEIDLTDSLTDNSGLSYSKFLLAIH